MNDDLNTALDSLLYFLDLRYGPIGKRTMTESKWRAKFEDDKMEFRKLLLACLPPDVGTKPGV